MEACGSLKSLFSFLLCPSAYFMNSGGGGGGGMPVGGGEDMGTTGL